MVDYAYIYIEATRKWLTIQVPAHLNKIERNIYVQEARERLNK